jgi:excisionase family DNA binding protein
MSQSERTEASKPANIGTVQDVAALLKIPVSCVYKYTRRDAIPMLRVGKYVRFDLEEVVRWAREQAGR